MPLQAQSLAQETLRILKPFWLLVVLSAALGVVSGLTAARVPASPCCLAACAY